MHLNHARYIQVPYDIYNSSALCSEKEPQSNLTRNTIQGVDPLPLAVKAAQRMRLQVLHMCMHANRSRTNNTMGCPANNTLPAIPRNRCGHTSSKYPDYAAQLRQNLQTMLTSRPRNYHLRLSKPGARHSMRCMSHALEAGSTTRYKPFSQLAAYKRHCTHHQQAAAHRQAATSPANIEGKTAEHCTPVSNACSGSASRNVPCKQPRPNC